jgi:hypothetical protein
LCNGCKIAVAVDRLTKKEPRFASLKMVAKKMISPLRDIPIADNTPKVAKKTVSFSASETLSSSARVWSTIFAKCASMGARNKSTVG